RPDRGASAVARRRAPRAARCRGRHPRHRIRWQERAHLPYRRQHRPLRRRGRRAEEEGTFAMTHRIKNRLLAPLVATMLVPTLVATSVLAAPRVASAAVSKAKCQLHAVLLSKEGDGTIPKDLEFLRSTFETDEFAAYKGFYLLERKTLKLELETKSD